jgi:MFS family permease
VNVRKSFVGGAGVSADHHNYKWWALSCTSLGMLLVATNSGTLIIALPDLERALGTSLLTLVWVILAYMISSTVLVLTAGRLSDLFGRKTAFVAAFLIFAAASLGAGFAANGTQLILWRIVRVSAAPSSSPTGPRSSPTPSRVSSSAWRWAPTRWSRRSAS